jgi:hypothetical protein
MQRDSLGQLIGLAESSPLQRGDLIFWRGHVAIARDAETIARIKAAGSEILATKRPT